MDNSSLNKNNKDDSVAVDKKRVERVVDKHVERVVDKHVERVVDKHVERVVDKHVEKKAQKKGWRKRIRDFIVDKHVDIIKRSGIPLDLACLIIKIVHFRLPFDLMLAASLSSPFVSLCIWLFVMSVFSCFLLLDGCVLSVIEYKLTGNSLNVMDIFLWMFGKETTYKNRYNSTVIAAFIYLSLFFGMVYYRRGFSKDNINKLLYFLTFSYFSGLVSDTQGKQEVESYLNLYNET